MTQPPRDNAHTTTNTSDLSELERIARDSSLDDQIKKDLIAALAARHDGEAARAAQQLQFEAEHRRGRWHTPLAVALTGLITITANFGYTYLQEQQKAKNTAAQTQQNNIHAASLAGKSAETEKDLQRLELEAKQRLASLTFQYDVIKSELANLETAEERANSLRFLVRVGILGEPLKLTEIEKIIAEVSEGDQSALPPVGGENNDYRHDYSPCAEDSYAAKVDDQFVSVVLTKWRSSPPTPVADMPQAVQALSAAMAENGICSADQVAAVLTLVIWDTAGFSTMAWSATSMQRDFDRRPQFFAGLFGDRETAIKYRPRGLAMPFGIEHYKSIATRMNRPDVMENPDILMTDHTLSAQALIQHLRDMQSLNHCQADACDFAKFARRHIGPNPRQDMLDLYSTILRTLNEWH